MTITIGFACKNAIAVLSDSQMSTGTDFKQFGVPKIFSICFHSGQYALVGVAGSLESANLFRDILERMSKTVDVTGTHTIADTVERAIKETRIKFLEYVDKDDLTPDERSEHLLTLGFDVVFAYYYNNTPYLFSSRFYHGRAIKCNKQYVLTGCGEDIASFILTGAKLEEFMYGDALGMAFYAIETCKRHSRGCGGDIQHLVLRNEGDGKPIKHSSMITGIYVRAFANTEKLVHDAIGQALRKEVRTLKEKEEDADPDED